MKQIKFNDTLYVARGKKLAKLTKEGWVEMCSFNLPINTLELSDNKLYIALGNTKK